MAYAPKWPMTILVAAACLLLGMVIQYVAGGVTQADHDTLARDLAAANGRAVAVAGILRTLEQGQARLDESLKAIDRRLTRIENLLDRPSASTERTFP